MEQSCKIVEGAKEMLLVEDVDSKEYLAGLFKAMYDELPVHRRNIDCGLFLFYTLSKLQLTM